MSSVGYQDDEITISEILRRLWRGRALIVLVPILFVTAAGVVLALTASLAHRPVAYFVELKGIENERYPNGTAFSPLDMVSPEVLSRIRTRFNVAEDRSLREAINVVYESPVTESISQVYRDRLNARNLSQAEIATINEDYQRELRSAMRSALRIEVNPALLRVDNDIAASIARAVPETWSEVFSTQFRIINDGRLAGAAITRGREDLTSTASLLVVNQRTRAMANGLAILAEDNRLSMIQTADGRSPGDLRQELNRFRTVWFNAIMSAGLEADVGVGAAYLADLRLQIDELQRRITTYEQSLADLRNFQRPQELSRLSETLQMPSNRDTVQLGDSGLGEIVQLAERASLASFMQEIVRERQSTAFEISELRRELEMATLNTQLGDSAAFRAEAASVLEELTDRYIELLGLAETRVRQQLGDLYVPLAAPQVLGSLVSPRAVLVIAAAGIAGGMLAAIFVLLRAALVAPASARRPRAA